MELHTPGRLIVFLLLAAVLAGAGYFRLRQADTAVQRLEQLPFVYDLRGNVARPGIYRFATEQTVAALAQTCGAQVGSAGHEDGPVAGGSRLTFAESVICGRMDAAALLSYFQPLPFKTASVDDLVLLPGIGPVRAAALVAWRDSAGEIGSLQDLLAVRGIGPRTLDRIAPYLQL